MSPLSLPALCGAKVQTGFHGSRAMVGVKTDTNLLNFSARARSWQIKWRSWQAGWHDYHGNRMSTGPGWYSKYSQRDGMRERCNFCKFATLKRLQVPQEKSDMASQWHIVNSQRRLINQYRVDVIIAIGGVWATCDCGCHCCCFFNWCNWGTVLLFDACVV